MGSGLRVDVLGPLRVRTSDGAAVDLGGPLRRRLLALLVLRRGTVVPADVAADAVWPGRRPDDPMASLQNHVSRLRRCLPDGLLTSVHPGYRLDPAGLDVDADRLTTLLSSPDPAAATELRQLLDGWHGPAYPELADHDDGVIEAARLEELRDRAREHIAALRLDAGDLDGLVTELASLADAHPLRERPHELLMEALAASGRTVEALRVFDDFRRRLGDDLGIEPSPALVARHGALLVGAPGTRRRVPDRLPNPPTRLIARDDLVEDLVERLSSVASASERVFTLIGPGGVGKTRVLIEVGHRLRGLDGDRLVAWCDLSGADESSVVDTVAAAMGIDVRLGADSLGRIVELFADEDAVVLVDNCEHVLDAVAGVVDRIVGSCTRVSVATTSRERLRVTGEVLVPVPVLAADGADSPAVELFVGRARAVDPRFGETDADRATAAEIVRRLDGLPLAIELAAARLHGLDVAEVAAGLDRRFALLSSGPRTSSRHGSLTAAVAWSYESLSEELRTTFDDVSVFARPFSPDDAAAVCDIDRATAADRLADLVDRSLVVRVARGMYGQLETLRAFGAERLARSARVDAVRDRHALRTVAWVEDADRSLGRPGRQALFELDDALVEVRAVVGRLVERGFLDDASRLVVALTNYGLLRLRPDVLLWSQLVLGAEGGLELPLAPSLLGDSAYGTWMAGDVSSARALVDRALELEASDPSFGTAPRVRVMRGNISLFDGDLDQAASWYQQAIEAAAHEAGEVQFDRATLLLAWGYASDPRVPALADELLGVVGDDVTAIASYIWYCAGEAVSATDVDLARSRLARSVELATATNASFVLGVAGATKASIEARFGDPEAAIADYRWLIEHWRRAGAWSTQWTMLRSVALLLARVGRFRDAAIVEGAVRSTPDGHRIFGADAIALDALSDRLRAAMGDADYDRARREGGALDGSTAVEHALRSL